MDLEQFLQTCAALNIKFEVKGNELGIEAEPSVLNEALVAELKSKKHAIIEWLKHQQQSATAAEKKIKRRGAEHALAQLSFSQQRLWLLDQLEPAKGQYNIPAIFELTGQLDLPALELAFAMIIARHEALRTVYIQQGSEVRQKVQSVTDFVIKQHDLSHLTDVQQQQQLQQLVALEISAPFELSVDVMLRVTLYRFSEQKSQMLIVMHHIASDAWSIKVLLHELGDAYAAIRMQQQPTMPIISVQYADFAHWQRNWLSGDNLELLLHYWRCRLADVPLLHSLPLDFSRPSEQSHRGDVLKHTISHSLRLKLEALAHQHQTGLYSILHAAFVYLLRLYSGEHDIVIGTPVANREQVELAPLIGIFVNSLVLRSDLSEIEDLPSLIEQSKQVLVDAYVNQNLPFERLVEELNPERSLSYHPLFQIMLSLQPYGETELMLPGIGVVSQPLSTRTTKLDLYVNITELKEGFEVEWEYATDLFRSERIEQMHQRFVSLLESFVANPAQRLSGSFDMSEHECQQLIKLGFSGQQPLIAPNFIEAFSRYVRQTPLAIAARDPLHEISYLELDHQSNGLAHYLSSAGVKAGDSIAVVAEHKIASLIQLLAVLKVGASYVPIDPDISARRLTQIIEQSSIRLGLVAEQQRPQFQKIAGHCHWLATDVLPVGSTPVPLETCMTDDSIAYQLFTSGSTGQPKGVQVSHRNLMNYLTAAQQLYQVQLGEAVLQFASLSFDASIEEIMLTLSQGGTLIYRDESCKMSSEAFWQWIDQHRIHLISLPTAFWHTLCATLNETHAAIAAKNLRGCIIGGESAQRHLICKWLNHTGVTVYNTYGPTETTVVATAQIYRADEQSEHNANVIGRPLVNYRCLILDQQQRLLPVGVPGELYIGGESVATGYAGAPQLSAEFFLTLSNFDSCERFYRTGDRVRWRDDGTIEYLGRLDQQLKIGSFRVEPGAITEELLLHPQVKEAFVTAMGEPKRLVAYVVAMPSSDNDEHQLLTWLKSRLPGYMIPAVLVQLDKIPMTRNGKVDVRALPQPLWQSVNTYRAPRNSLEAQLVEIWSKLLGVAELGIDHNFFQLGGNSLLAVQLISDVQQKLNCKIPSRAILEKPTIAELVGELVVMADVEHDLTPLQGDQAGRYEPFPLTEIQQAYWLGRRSSFELGNVGTHGYTELPIPTRLLTRFEQAWRHLIQRHDMLRMVVTENSEQRILAETPEYQFVYHDLQDADEASQAAHFERMRDHLSHQVFSGQEWPLFDIQLTKCSAEKSVIHFSIDALIVDASSLMIIGDELARLLDDPDIQLPQQNITFRDYVLATNERKHSAAYQEAQRYWCDRVANFPAAPQLPLQRQPAAILVPKFERRTRCLEPTRWQKLQNIAKAFQLTPTCLLLGCLAEVLNRWSEQPHFALNLTLFRRENIHPDVAGLVGDFTSLSLLEMDFRDVDSRFIDRLRELQGRLWLDIEHSAFDGISMQKALNRHHGHHLGYPIVLTSTLGLDSRGSDAPRLEELLGVQSLTQGLYAITQTSQVWLDVKVTEGSGALYCDWDSVQGLFPEHMLDHMLDAFWQLITTLCDSPMTVNERAVIELPQTQQELIRQTNDTAAHFDCGTLFSPIVSRAKLQPDAIAVQSPDQVLSYSALVQRSQFLACELVQRGCKVGDRVAIVMEKGWQQVVAVLGIQQAGAAYLPIDGALPAKRIAMLLELGEVSHVISTKQMISVVPAEYLVLDIDQWTEWSWAETVLPDVSPTDLAYIIFTSGSTGQPKGVMMDHQAVSNTIQDINKRFAVTAGDRVLGLSNLSFDLSVYDIFGVLAAGGTLVLPAPDELRDPSAWQAYLEHSKISVWNTVPALLQILLDHIGQQQLNTSMRLVMLSGDWIATDMPAQIKHLFPQAHVISLGGATEAAIWSIYYPITKVAAHWTSIPYGRPLANQHFYVMNQALEICPIYVEGDLYIAGDGLALGYWRDQQKTEQSFFSHPLTLQRLYRTGDRGRWLADGDIEFLGRTDSQVKLRGYRIELGEIVHQLKQHPAIQASEVVLHKAASGQQQLVAYLILEDKMRLSDEEELKVQLQKSLADKLPDYMIPACYMFLEKWPLSANGKLDRKALPAPISNGGGFDIQRPATENERKLAKIWAELLRIPLSQLSVEANFFELGGDSILAIQVVSRAAKVGLHCKVRDLFTGQNLRQLAQSAVGAQAIGAEEQIAGKITLLPIQQEFLTDSNEVHHFNQAVLLIPPSSMVPEDLAKLLAKLLQRHDALRLKFVQSGGQWHGEYQDYNASMLQRVQVFHDWTGDDFETLEPLATKIQASLAPEQGDVIRAAWIENTRAGRRLLLVIHHLVIDGVSWRILLEDLELLWTQYQQNQPLALAAKTTSYQQWGAFLQSYGQNADLLAEQQFWLAQHSRDCVIEDIAKRRYPDEVLSEGRQILRARLTAEKTKVLFQQCNRRYRTQSHELLLAGCFSGVQHWGGISSLSLDLEGHGRESLAEHIDLSQTVGWFTASYPLRLHADSIDVADLICSIKEQFRAIPNHGIGFGVLKYLTKVPSLVQLGRHELSFNYLGQFDQVLNNSPHFEWAREPSGDTASDQQRALHRLIFTSVVVDGQLEMSLEFAGERFSTVAMVKLLDAIVQSTEEIIEHCRQSDAGRLTPSDFPLAKLDAMQLAYWQSEGELEDVYPVTGMQQGMLFHSQMDPQSYITQTILTFEHLNVEVFQHAWREVVQRHAVFRSRFTGLDSSNPLQLVQRRVDLPWQQFDLSALAVEEQSQKIEQLRCLENTAGFDPQQAPLMRMCLIRTDSHHYRLIWTVHHALMDGWCVSLVYGEVCKVYDALLEQREAQLPPVALYRDYVAWLQKQNRQKAQDYWKGELAKVTATTPLPLARGRELIANEHGVHTTKVSLGEELSRQLAERARTERVTVNVLFQAAWSLLLSRYADQSLVVFGATTAARPAELPQVEQMVGLFINTLPVVVEVDEQTSVRQWLQLLHHQVVEREQFSYLSLAEIQRQSQIKSDLFQSILVFENYPFAELTQHSPALRMIDTSLYEGTHYGLSLTIYGGRNLEIKMDVEKHILSAEAASQILAHLQHLLGMLASGLSEWVSDLSLFDTDEQLQLQQMLQGPVVRHDFVSLPSMFAAQAATNSDAIALVDGESRLSYGELASHVIDLAHALQAEGVKPGDRVGVSIARSAEMLVALLAIQSAGAAYVPLDPAYPVERLKYMVEDAQLRLIINGPGQESLFSETAVYCCEMTKLLATKRDFVAPEVIVQADDAAYVIYTSGSTGSPKGVVVSHCNLSGFLCSMTESPGISNTDRLLAVTSISFDIHILELFLPLVSGAVVVIAKEQQTRSAHELMKLLTEHSITMMQATPFTWELLLEQRWRPERSFVALCGGEALNPILQEQLIALPQLVLWNMYGPTETTVWSSVAQLSANAPVHLGTPIHNTTFYICDRYGRLMPRYACGELFIAGAGVAIGYHGQSELSMESFSLNPYARQTGERWYRTGDLVRLDEHGRLLFVARKDQQIKRQGYRIELGEIETLLQRHPQVDKAIITLVGERQNLCAHLVTADKGDQQRLVQNVRDYLAEYLPSFMLPSSYRIWVQLPMTVNGKVDRKQLTAINPEPMTQSLPQTEVQLQLLNLITDLLQVDAIGIEHSFFELGGDSLLAMQLIGRINNRWQLDLHVKEVFVHPTVLLLANLIQQLLAVRAEQQQYNELEKDFEEGFI